MAPRSTREKILASTVELLTETGAATASIRQLAERSGVSVGALQHHFPTKRALMEAALPRVYGDHGDGHGGDRGDDRITDGSIPAADRLAACLRGLIASPSPRDAWRAQLERADVLAPDEARDEFLAIEHARLDRIMSWLATLRSEGAPRNEGALHSEGAPAAGDDVARARFLAAVVDGISAGQALPGEDERLPHEQNILRTAVDAVLTAQGEES